MLALVLSAALLASPLADDGQGPAASEAFINDLTVGTHWIGAPFDKGQATGQVTIVTYWGT